MTRGARAGRRPAVTAALAACLTVALSVLLTVAGGTGAAALPPEQAATTAEAEPVQAAPGVPEEVLESLSREGGALVIGLGAGELDVTPEERAAIRPGLVRTVSTWSPVLLAGGEPDPPSVPVERWIVPLLLDGVPMGVLTTGLDPEDEEAPARILADAEFGAALQGLARDDVVVHDVPLDAWFTIVDGEVVALDEVARANLAGAVPLSLYQPLVAARYVTDAPEAAPEPADEPGPQPVLWVALAAAALLAWAGVTVWLRRPEGAPQGPRGTRRHPG